MDKEIAGKNYLLTPNTLVCKIDDTKYEINYSQILFVFLTDKKKKKKITLDVTTRADINNIEAALLETMPDVHSYLRNRTKREASSSWMVLAASITILVLVFIGIKFYDGDTVRMPIVLIPFFYISSVMTITQLLIFNGVAIAGAAIGAMFSIKKECMIRIIEPMSLKRINE